MFKVWSSIYKSLAEKNEEKSWSAFLAPKFLDFLFWSPSLTLLAHGRLVVQAGQASRPGEIQALWEIYSSSLFVGPDFGQP